MREIKWGIKCGCKVSRIVRYWRVGGMGMASGRSWYCMNGPSKS
ncbi:MAG: hypothetical protein Hyperionvirus5_53 [Hyperionvirus sp.]|uniref:Uncharacterized protein n=1 Tax=Hyperionvirus sp. TaxID=2487770 RepID=A0A3G5A7M5_9VIRU|nr:MAG: hypothetical protein Hyperionvirus5_53 [Hyperionvirus sp.]